MPLEDLTGPDKYFDAFNTSWPTDNDPRPEGDDHIRGIKNVLVNTFGGLTAAFVDLAHKWTQTQTFEGQADFDGDAQFKGVATFDKKLATHYPIWPPAIIVPGMYSGNPNFSYFRAVQLRGNSISSAAGNGTELASDALEGLYKQLWSAVSDEYCPVEGGRGASADEDWDADKAMTLPDYRGRAIIGSGSGAGLTVRVRGDTGGEERVTLTEDEMPSHQHGLNFVGAYGGGGAGAISGAGSNTGTSSTGGGASHENMSPWGVASWLITY